MMKLDKWKNEFISNYDVLNNNEKKIYEQAFWEAVEFLKDREADNIERAGKATELFSKTE